MKQYLNLLREVRNHGTMKPNRTGINTQASFGHTLKFDMTNGFPILTSKKIHWPSVVHELLWFISGETNIEYLQQKGVRIWNEWADENGNLGPVYGRMWRKFPSYIAIQHDTGFNEVSCFQIDQLQNVIDKLKTNPYDRRLVVSAWNPVLLPDDNLSFAENVAKGKQALPPCHYSFQFVTTWNDSHKRNELNLIWNQRSVDLFLGLPFNISSYALLLHMVAHVVGMTPRMLMFSGADCHIYENHFDAVDEQLSRAHDLYELPDLKLNPNVDCLNFTYEDIELVGYKHHPAIKGKVAV